MLNKLEFKYPLNILYITFLILTVIILILAHRKKERILNVLKTNTKIQFEITRIILYAAAFALIVFSLMGPQIFKGYTEVKSTGMDIYVLIDTSKSMMVEDIEPDRISRAKNIIGEILNNLEGDRIGFIPFSSGAYIQLPLTDDYQLARMFLDVIDTDMISGGGTNIGAAINLANNSFKQASSSDKVIIILSDGEEHDSGSMEILRNINNERLKVYTIGIGTENGGLIPVYDSKGEKRIDYKRDDNGNYITSQLNSDILKKLAELGKGSYYQTSVSGNEIGMLMKDISTLKRDVSTTKKIRAYTQIYQYFLGPGLVLLLAAYFLSEGRKKQ